LLPWITILGWAYLLGVMSSAPIGPVNMLAIWRGVHGRWTHALFCGIGSALVDSLWFAAVLAGGQAILRHVDTPAVHKAFAIVGAVVLVPLGAAFLIRATRLTLRDVARMRKKYKSAPPTHLWRDVLSGFGITVINPGTMLFWIGPGAFWLASARRTIGPQAAWWGWPLGLAGSLSWFAALAMIIRFMPDRVGPKFLRSVNGLCGVILLGAGLLAVAEAFWSVLP
jgi:threonine/homoserine/homoserine lactone efflux protein